MMIKQETMLTSMLYKTVLPVTLSSHSTTANVVSDLFTISIFPRWLTVLFFII